MGLVQDIAQTTLEQGRIQGEGAARAGQIWGTTIANLGQLPAQIRQQQQQDQENRFRQQEMALRTQSLGLQVQGQQSQQAQQQRQQADQDALDTAIQQGTIKDASGRYAPDHQKISDYLVQSGKAHLLAPLQQSWNASAESAVKLSEAQQKVAAAEADDIGGLATRGLTLLDKGASPDDAAGAILPDVAAHVANTVISRDTGARIMGQLDAARKDPAQLKALLQSWQASSKTQMDAVRAGTQAESDTAEANNRKAQLPGLVAKSTQEQAVTAGMANGLTPEEQRLEADRRVQLKQGDQRLGIEGARLNLERNKAGAENKPLDLTPGGLDAAALNYMKTGQLPALGMGDKITRKSIINRAAELGSGTGDPIRTNLDLASNRAGFVADEGSLKKLQGQRDAITAFENTASKNIDQFLKTAGKVVDTGSPLLNAPLRAISAKLLGSPDQAAYEAARQVAINEVAKVTGNPTLSGTLSDSARKEVEAFNPSNATLGQTVAVLKLLKQDMANRASATDEAIGEIQKRIKGGSMASPATADPLVVNGFRFPTAAAAAAARKAAGLQ